MAETLAGYSSQLFLFQEQEKRQRAQMTVFKAVNGGLEMLKLRSSWLLILHFRNQGAECYFRCHQVISLFTAIY